MNIYIYIYIADLASYYTYHEIKRIIVTFLRGLSKGYVRVSISPECRFALTISKSSCTKAPSNL